MSFKQGYAWAARCGLKREFAYAFKRLKPWYAFWISEETAVTMALAEWDLLTSQGE